ncbi:MAG: D-sedoheptulose 7-phosphate isomerase [bacterium]
MQDIQNTVISVRNQIEEHNELIKNVLENENFIKQIEDVASEAIKAYQRGNKILVAGNGGSAADAQHIAGELVSRFYFDRPGLAAIALTTDTSILTAIGNDYGYDSVFARQVQANGVNGDIFIGITTSGNSPNIITAFEQAKKMGIMSVCLTGKEGGNSKLISDYCLCVPSSITPRIQEVHILIGHILCAIIEEALFGKK